VDLTFDGDVRKAVIVPNKRGELFLLDLETSPLLADVMDGQLRAIDVLNGRVVWQTPLPGASRATLLSYLSPTTGKTIPADDDTGRRSHTEHGRSRRSGHRADNRHDGSGAGLHLHD
jgi:glucose dehydrogenase